MLEPNTRYRFEYLIHFRAETEITLGMIGPVKPTFSTFRVETPLLATAKPLQIQRGPFNALIRGKEGVVCVKGTIRTGIAGGTLLPRYVGNVCIEPESTGALYDST